MTWTREPLVRLLRLFVPHRWNLPRSTLVSGRYGALRSYALDPPKGRRFSTRTGTPESRTIHVTDSAIH